MKRAGHQRRGPGGRWCGDDAPRLAAALAVAALAAGCATSALDQSRAAFYHGDFDGSVAALDTAGATNATDRVLVLLERATANQARARYAESVEDWLRAKALAEEMDYLSVSQQSASMVVNDNVIAYRGAPYERVLLHAFVAQSFMAMSLWEDAGVAGRNIVRRLENRGDYPDDPYSRYVAALGMEMGNDPQGAAFQYAQAARAARRCAVDSATGRLGPPQPADTNAATGAAPAPAFPPPAAASELICLVGIGRGPSGGHSASANWRWGSEPYAEFYADGKLLGRSYTLVTADELMQATEEVTRLRESVKSAARVALKETASQVVSEKNETLGELLRFFLFALERDDVRMWETLPQWLGAARLPCPPNLDGFDVVFRSADGRELERRTVTAPIPRQHGDFVCGVRAL